jgi:hypothetical protein
MNVERAKEENPKNCVKNRGSDEENPKNFANKEGSIQLSLLWRNFTLSLRF